MIHSVRNHFFLFVRNRITQIFFLLFLIENLQFYKFNIRYFYNYQNSVFQVMAGVFLFFCRFESEIFFLLFSSYGEEHAYTRFNGISQILNMPKYILKKTQSRVHS